MFVIPITHLNFSPFQDDGRFYDIIYVNEHKVLEALYFQ